MCGQRSSILLRLLWIFLILIMGNNAICNGEPAAVLGESTQPKKCDDQCKRNKEVIKAEGQNVTETYIQYFVQGSVRGSNESLWNAAGEAGLLRAEARAKDLGIALTEEEKNNWKQEYLGNAQKEWALQQSRFR
jgi:hypothetical protein